jgi:hypothetical protein
VEYTYINPSLTAIFLLSVFIRRRPSRYGDEERAVRAKCENRGESLEVFYPVARNHYKWLRVERALHGGGEALNPSLIAYIGPSLTFTIQGTVLAA